MGESEGGFEALSSPSPARRATRLNRKHALICSALAALCAGGVGLAGAQTGANEKGGLPDGNFPVRGQHQYWDGFGAGRGHTGQDIGADCGTRIEVAQKGRVVEKASDGSGYGNYVVINVKGDNTANFYAHMKDKAKRRDGERVDAGDFLGKVGQTGNATGCHLHFEYWKGSYPGGHPSRKVTRVLKHWDRIS
jgi:murein DD-endopeptidase MepM/ murein hydrolase activator NlpD